MPPSTTAEAAATFCSYVYLPCFPSMRSSTSLPNARYISCHLLTASTGSERAIAADLYPCPSSKSPMAAFLASISCFTLKSTRIKKASHFSCPRNGRQFTPMARAAMPSCCSVGVRPCASVILRLISMRTPTLAKPTKKGWVYFGTFRSVSGSVRDGAAAVRGREKKCRVWRARFCPFRAQTILGLSRVNRQYENHWGKGFGKGLKGLAIRALALVFWPFGTIITIGMRITLR